jgi:diguanylate cyclase (GGDEF)-like protein
LRIKDSSSIIKRKDWKLGGKKVDVLLRYDVMIKMIILLGEWIVLFYLIHQYKEYSYTSKSKVIIMVVGVTIYMGGTLLSLFQEFFKELQQNRVDSIELTLEAIGILLLARGLYLILVELIKVSNIDFLTKTYTKRYIDKAFEDTKVLSDKKESVFSVIFIDIDNFKQVNDRFGHEKGNVALTEIATVLKETVRETDKVGRYGGDEFIILLEKTTYEEAEIVLERIRKAISSNQSFELYEIGVSGGVATYPYDGESIQTLSLIADMRMYEDKDKNKEGNVVLV